jgi:hypothetical protein
MGSYAFWNEKQTTHLPKHNEQNLNTLQEKLSFAT